MVLSKPIIVDWKTKYNTCSESSYESAYGHILARTLTALKRDKKNGLWNKI